MINGYSILNGGIYCSKDDGSQNYLVFQPDFKYFKSIAIGITISREYKALSDKNIKLPPLSDNSSSIGCEVNRTVFF